MKNVLIKTANNGDRSPLYYFGRGKDGQPVFTTSSWTAPRFTARGAERIWRRLYAAGQAVECVREEPAD
jgi:hypothetical protein